MTHISETQNFSAGPSLSRSALVLRQHHKIIFLSKRLAPISAPRQNPCARPKPRGSPRSCTRTNNLPHSLHSKQAFHAVPKMECRQILSPLFQMPNVDDLKWHKDQSDVPPVPPTMRARKESPVSLTYPAPSFTFVLAAERPVFISSRLVKAP